MFVSFHFIHDEIHFYFFHPCFSYVLYSFFLVPHLRLSVILTISDHFVVHLVRLFYLIGHPETCLLKIDYKSPINNNNNNHQHHTNNNNPKLKSEKSFIRVQIKRPKWRRVRSPQRPQPPQQPQFNIIELALSQSIQCDRVSVCVPMLVCISFVSLWVFFLNSYVIAYTACTLSSDSYFSFSLFLPFRLLGAMR